MSFNCENDCTALSCELSSEIMSLREDIGAVYGPLTLEQRDRFIELYHSCIRSHSNALLARQLNEPTPDDNPLAVA